MIERSFLEPRHATPRHAREARGPTRHSGTLIALSIAVVGLSTPIATTSCSATGQGACQQCDKDYLHECFDNAPVAPVSRLHGYSRS